MDGYGSDVQVLEVISPSRGQRRGSARGSEPGLEALPAPVRAPAARRTAGRLRRRLTRRGSILAEAVCAVVIYGVYEIVRGLLAGDVRTALAHATDVASLERSLHIFVERDLQVAARTIPGALPVLGALYLTMHLGFTGGHLVWLYRRRPNTYPVVRTMLIVSTVLSLVVFVLYPTAPPRMAGLGIVDTVSGQHFNLNSGLVKLFYNPFAAVPSMHFGYALIIGTSLVCVSRTLVAKLSGIAYPLLVLFIIVVTGNHFFLDAVAGAIVVVASAVGTALLMRGAPAFRLRTRRAPSGRRDAPSSEVVRLTPPRRPALPARPVLAASADEDDAEYRVSDVG